MNRSSESLLPIDGILTRARALNIVYIHIYIYIRSIGNRDNKDHSTNRRDSIRLNLSSVNRICFLDKRSKAFKRRSRKKMAASRRIKRGEIFHPSFEDVEIKVARQFFRVLNLISAIGLPSVCREDTEAARYRCFHRANIKRMMQRNGEKKRRRKFFVEIEERKRELRL